MSEEQNVRRIRAAARMLERWLESGVYGSETFTGREIDLLRTAANVVDFSAEIADRKMRARTARTAEAA